MFRVWNCLELQHDWRLVVLAAFVCFLTCLAAVNLFQRACVVEGRARFVWLLAAGLSPGSGVWATHVIAMLAYMPGFPLEYDLGLTTLSLLISTGMTTAGFVIALFGGRRWGGVAGGALVGIGIACMHYMGMASLIMPADIIWNPELVIASIVVGTALGAAALPAAQRSDTPMRVAGAATLLSLAIVSHHFIAMAALGFIPHATTLDGATLPSPVALSLAIAAVAVAVVIAGIVFTISDRRSRSQISERNMQLDAALNNMGQGLCMFGPDNRLQVWNQRYVTMYGIEPKRLFPGCSIDDMLAARDAAGSEFKNTISYRAKLDSALEKRARATSLTELPDGRLIYVTYEPLQNGGWVATHEDISEREMAKRDLEQARSFLDSIIETVPSAIIVKELPDLRYALINHAGEQHLGLDRQQILGRRACEVFPPEIARSIEARDREVLDSDVNSVSHEYEFETLGGVPRAVITKRVALKDSAGKAKYLISAVHDITERKQSEARIDHLAHHDSLTDLPNRAAFNERIEATIKASAENGNHFSVLCVDLDRFKEVNDIFGHSTGDQLLCEVAKRLNAACEGAFVARLGGDEFTMISSSGEQPATAEGICARVAAAFRSEFQVNNHTLNMTCTIGVSVYPQDGKHTEVLVANADTALHRAKAESRGSVCFFEQAMDEQIRERRMLQRDLVTAIANCDFKLFYQPQVTAKGEIVAFEALLRWRHPVKGMISPAVFIPLAEETGLIGQIDEWVLREACREAATWANPLSIAVNLSPIAFRGVDLPALIHAVLFETGLSAKRLEIEITEGVLIDDFDRAISVLRRIKNMGVRIAMDDFGTGYSSLSYFQSFPFDKIKIDQTFVAKIDKNAQSVAIIRAIIGLAHGLNLPVIAEGVETAEQLAFLEQEGCDEIQGYLTGRPQPIAHYWQNVGQTAQSPELAALAG